MAIQLRSQIRSLSLMSNSICCNTCYGHTRNLHKPERILIGFLGYVFIQNNVYSVERQWSLDNIFCDSWYVRNPVNKRQNKSWRWRKKDRDKGRFGGDNLTFGKGVRLNDIEKRMDHVEEDTHGSWLVICVCIINCRRYKTKIQRLHWRRGPLSAGVRPDLNREPVPLIRLLLLLLLLAGCGPPAEQQDDPPCPQHGSGKSSFVQNKTIK